MHVKINEKIHDIAAESTVFSLKDAIKPDADIIIRNGAVLSEDEAIQEGDSLVFIKRGEIPPEDELEHLMAARHTPGVHEKIKSATVGIAGLGGLGSAIAVALARIGIGKLILADFDVVEPSNLNRQQYFTDQIGLYKTDALARNLKRINPYVALESFTTTLTPANIGEIFSSADVILEAFDTAAAKAMLVEYCSLNLQQTPLVCATGLAGHAPSNSIKTRKMGSNLYVVGDLHTAACPGTGLMAPRVGVAAHHQANAVLRILLGEAPEAE